MTGGIMLSTKRSDVLYQTISNEPDSLSVSDYDQMANFPTIAHAMSVVKSLYATRDWYVAGKDKKKADFIDSNLRPIWDKFINDCMTGMEYGFAPFYIEWAFGKEYRIKNIVPLKPHYINILTDEVGQYNGLEQEIWCNGKKAEVIQFEASKTFLYTYDMKFDNYYGRSRLRAARFPYVIWKFVSEMTNMFYEKFADPTKIGFAPAGKAPTKEGKEKTNTELLNDRLKELNVGGNKDITLPSEVDDKGNRRWDVKLLESSRTGADYIDYLKYLDSKICQGVLVNELAFAQSGGAGSYNLFEGQNSILSYKSDLDMSQLAFHIQQYLINPLISYNFGDEFLNDYSIKFTKASKDNKELVNQLLQASMQNRLVRPDYDQLSRITGIKFTESIEDTAKAILGADGKPVVTPAVTVEKKEPKEDKSPEQMELFPCKCGKKHNENFATRSGLTQAEMKVNFEELKKVYDGVDAIKFSLSPLIEKIRKNAIAGSKKAYADGNIDKLSNFALSDKQPYIDKYTDDMAGVFETTRGLTQKELGLTAGLNEGTKQIERIKARDMAGKQISDLEFNIRNILLAGYTNNTAFDVVSQQINDYFNEVNDGLTVKVTASVQQFVDDGRRDAADDPEVELAQWSAVLDDNACYMCGDYLDGMVTTVGSTEYNEFTPGNLHINCRCVWVYILKSESNKPPVDFVSPDKDLQDKYMRR